MMKNKYIFAVIFFLFFLFAAGGVAMALEVKYPNLPGLPDINRAPGLPDYVRYFFGLGVYIGIALSAISFVVGAVKLIGAGVSGNPESRGDGIDRIKGAVLGLILTVSAFVILSTINYNITVPTLSPLPGVAGIYITNGQSQKSVSDSVSDTSALPQGYNQILYCCNNLNNNGSCPGGSGPALLIWEFANKGLENGDKNLSNVRVVRKNCGETENISGVGSFKMTTEISGVYYFLGANCAGYGSIAAQNDEEITSPFKQNIKSVRIVNDGQSGLYYGVIFHKDPDISSGGVCGLPIINTGQQSICMNINAPASAANIFRVNPDPLSSGTGVSFYSEPYKSTQAARAGFIDLTKEQIGNLYKNAANQMNFVYDDPKTGRHINQTDEYKEKNKTFQDSPGSIEIKGSYLVALYSQENSFCQTFTSDANDLTATLASGVSKKLFVYIIPTK